MSEESFTVNQLREEIEGIRRRYSSEIVEKDAEIRELKAAIKTKRRIEDVTHAEYTYEYFPRLVVGILNAVDPKKKMSFLYLKAMSLINYMIVCGIGVFINMFIIYALIKYLPLWLANLGAISMAFLWNWTLSIGPLGFVFGLSPRDKRVGKPQR